MALKLVVGLGNPGARYECTRHNAGFQVIDRLSSQLHTAVSHSEHQAHTGRVTVAGIPLMLAKPQTFMNSSGEAVRALVNYYRIALSELLVIYDDLDLPTGRLRLRPKGSAGGHNGVRSIIDCLGTDNFARLRIGIGAVPPGWEGADYVLSRFNPDEIAGMESAYTAAAAAVLLWAQHGVDRAMAQVNRRPEPNAAEI